MALHSRRGPTIFARARWSSWPSGCSEGRKLTIFDARVQLSRLIGGNKSYIQQRLPHLADLLTQQIDDLAECELVAIGQPIPDGLTRRWLESGIRVLDLTGTSASARDAELMSIV